MTASAYLDACGFNPTSGGTGTWTVNAAITGYQTPAQAGAANGAVYSYRAESNDKSLWEEGYGAYTVSGTTLARSTVTANSSGGTTAINFTSAPNVFITAASADLRNAGLLNSGTVPTAQLGSGTASSSTYLRGDSSWQTITFPAADGLVSIVDYASTQTITIPSGATRGRVRMFGGSGGGGSGSCSAGSGGSGAGALEKFLNGLTTGNTLAYTQGAAGTHGTSGNNGTAGGSSTLTSGTQTITTLTASGGGAGGGNGGVAGSGGTGTNGDRNYAGQKGANANGTNPGGMTGLGLSVGGNGAPSGSTATDGTVGGLTIEWYN